MDSRVEDTDWSQALEAQLRRELPRLASCAKPTTARAFVTFELEFDRYGNAEGTHVLASDSTDCNVVECLRRLLRTVKAEPLPFGNRVRHSYTLDLFGGSVRRAEKPQALSSLPRGMCADLATRVRRPEPVSGAEPPQRVHEVIAENRSTFRRCYDHLGLSPDGRLAGSMTTLFSVGADGGVESARILHNTIPNCFVARCFRDTLKALRFDPGTSDTFEYTFLLMTVPALPDVLPP